jgi:hypothetical protein
MKAKLVIVSAAVAAFVVPTGVAAAAVGTFVEAEGRRVGGVLRLTSIHRED